MHNKGLLHDDACGERSRYHDTDCLTLEDYFRRLGQGANASARVLDKSLQSLLGSGPWSMAQDSTQHDVAVFNPLGSARTAVVEIVLPQSLRVAANKAAPEVRTAAGKLVVAQMAASGASLFCSVNLPAAATLSLRLVAPSGRSTTLWPTITASAPKAPVKSKALSVTFSTKGAVARITHLSDGVTVEAAQRYMAYHTSMGGPYMLVEAGPAQPIDAEITVETVSGPVFTEVTQTLAGWGSASATLPGPKQLHNRSRSRGTAIVSRSSIARVRALLPAAAA